MSAAIVVSDPRNNKSWHALTIELEPSAREAVEYALLEAGALGTETRDQSDGLLNVVGYFEVPPDPKQVRTELLEALRIYNLASSTVREITAGQIENRDWLEEWKKSWNPVVAGKFIIAPPWTELVNHQDQIVIRIEPGMAFGTGTHETTRLCLAAIEKYFVGKSFLDVGTGTGILAIAATKLYPDAHVEACDIDEDAISIARENAQANNVFERIQFRVGSVDESSSSADMVCANLTADVISPLLGTLLGVTCGKLILSGILKTQLATILDELRGLGVSEVEVTEEDEWVCCAL